jgi:hypothetical protein
MYGLISFFGVPLHSLRHHGYGKGCYNVRLGLSLLLVVRTASPSLKLKDYDKNTVTENIRKIVHTNLTTWRGGKRYCPD